MEVGFERRNHPKAISFFFSDQPDANFSKVIANFVDLVLIGTFLYRKGLGATIKREEADGELVKHFTAEDLRPSLNRDTYYLWGIKFEETTAEGLKNLIVSSLNKKGAEGVCPPRLYIFRD